MKETLRYRYMAWVESKIDKLDDEINEIDSRSQFSPQESYSFDDQLLLPFLLIIVSFYILGLRIKRSFEKLGLSEKLTVRKVSFVTGEKKE